MTMRGTAPCTIVLLLLAGCSSGPVERDPTAKAIPFLPERPQLDREIQPGEWEDTLLINGVFRIRDGTAAQGDYPFDLRLGHDDKWLFALMVVHKVPIPNVFDGTTNPDRSDKHPWGFNLFMDTRMGSALQSPSDWKNFVNFGPVGPSHTDDGYWADSEWVLQNEGGDPENKPWDGNRPTSGTWGRGFYLGNDIIWEIYVPLKNKNKEHDGFQVSRGDVFRACLLWEVQGARSPDARGLLAGPHDTYPGDGYNPHGCYDPSGWLRLQLA